MAQPDMIGMAVREMAATLKFYRLLGLDIPAGVESEDHVEVHANGYRIAWDTIALIKGFNPDWNEYPTGQRMTLAFKCENAAEVDALYQKVLVAGYGSHKAPWDAFWGQRYAFVIDPDGNMVDLFAAL